MIILWNRSCSRAVGLLACLLGVAACAGLNDRIEPVDPQASIVGLGCNLELPNEGSGQMKCPQEVYFARVDDTGKLVLDKKNDLIRATLLNNSYALVLNAPPGRYAVVAFYRSQPLPIYPVPTYNNTWNIFSRDLVKQSEIRVDPGTIAYMGNLRLVAARENVASYKPDETQAQVLAFLKEHFLGNSLLLIGAITHYMSVDGGQIIRDAAREREFLEKLLWRYDSTGWGTMIENRLREVSAFATRSPSAASRRTPVPR